jgi:DNA adenine methylase
MKYMGSKARHAKDILPIILAGRKAGQFYVEPFVGGANTIDKVDGNRIGADIHPHLIAMWRAVSDGWMPPQEVSEDEYNECNNRRRNEHGDPILGYVGFVASYAGKWYGGFARDSAGARDYAAEGFRSAQKQFPKLRGVRFECADYRELDIPPNSIIYCDPPYRGTTGYASGAFDHDYFWHWCGDMHAAGNSVFVSEYEAPEGWKCVWSKEVNNTLAKGTGSKKGIERLFTLYS